MNRRDPLARRALAALCIGLFAFAVTRKGHSAESVDVRTYVEMMSGIAAHGLPWLDNGPADRFVVLRPPWNVFTNGHLWGVYSPLYPYFAAPFLLIGGLRLATIATFALTIPIALATFFLARRVIEDERRAFFAAAITTLATPILAKSLELTAYPLAVLLAILATHATLIAIESATPRYACIAAGIFYALGSATHLLCVPIGAALLGALAVCGRSGEGRAPGLLRRTPIAAYWPTGSTLRKAGLAALVQALCTVPLVLLNRLRFGMLNPFTYGPTPWRGSTDNGLVDQTNGGHLRYATPVLLVVCIAVVAVVLATAIERRSTRRLVQVAAVIGAAGVLASSPILRARGAALAQTLFAYVFDQSVVKLDAPYERAPGAFGYLFGPWVVKSTLQCTPLLLLALTSPELDPRKRQRRFVLLAASAALYAYLMLRANLPLHSALGFPWVYIRYTMPALPLLAVVALLGGLPRPNRIAWALAALLGLGVVVWLGQGDDDRALSRQVLVLAVPLILGALTLACVVAFRRGKLPASLAGAVLLVLVGTSIGTTLGHELRANLEGKSYCDFWTDVMRREAPERFALIGYLPPMEPMLALRAERDIEYADLYQVESWNEARPVLEHWFETQRPIFWVVDKGPMTSPWPDLVFEPVGVDGRIYRVVQKVRPS